MELPKTHSKFCSRNPAYAVGMEGGMFESLSDRTRIHLASEQQDKQPRFAQQGRHLCSFVLDVCRSSQKAVASTALRQVPKPYQNKNIQVFTSDHDIIHVNNLSSLFSGHLKTLFRSFHSVPPNGITRVELRMNAEDLSC